jgi:hypothetical protein
MSWATTDDARASTWKDAATIDDTALDKLLDVATEQCQAFAPVLPEGMDVPARYTQAVVLQARELWAAARRDGDVITGDTYALRARDLTATVRQLLRPRRGRPGIG